MRIQMYVAVVLLGFLAANSALAEQYTSGPKLAPLYPSPPYLATQTEHLSIVFEADEAVVRELLPAGVQPAKGNTALLNMYTVRDSVGLGSYSVAYISYDVEGFDSPTGMKGRWMVQGWYGPDQATAAFREMFGYPVVLGTTRVERQGERVRAVLTRHGAELIEAQIRLTGKSFGQITGVTDYPSLRQVARSQSGEIASSEIVSRLIPWAGELLEAEPVSITLKVPDKDPLKKLAPKKLLGAWMFKGTAISIGHATAVKSIK